MRSIMWCKVNIEESVKILHVNIIHLLRRFHIRTFLWHQILIIDEFPNLIVYLLPRWALSTERIIRECWPVFASFTAILRNSIPILTCYISCSRLRWNSKFLSQVQGHCVKTLKTPIQWVLCDNLISNFLSRIDFMSLF